MKTSQVTPLNKLLRLISLSCFLLVSSAGCANLAPHVSAPLDHPFTINPPPGWHLARQNHIGQLWYPDDRRQELGFHSEILDKPRAVATLDLHRAGGKSSQLIEDRMGHICNEIPARYTMLRDREKHIVMENVIAIYKQVFYAGAYVYADSVRGTPSARAALWTICPAQK
jgi:hypothetical protein